MSDHDCALVAAQTLVRLQRSGIRGKILAYSAGDMAAAHAMVAFAVPTCAGVFLFDEEGTRHVERATMEWSARAIAQAAFGGVRSARWVGAASKPSLRGRNRRLSPRESRDLPRFDLLMETRER